MNLIQMVKTAREKSTWLFLFSGYLQLLIFAIIV